MTMILELPEKLEAALREEAMRRDLPEQEIVLMALDRALSDSNGRTPNKVSALMKRLQEASEDPEEQESLEDVFFAMDEVRAATGQRLLFPPELKGKSW